MGMRASQSARGWLFAGLVLYAVSFIMPAVTDVGDYRGNEPLPGYFCAWITVDILLGAFHGISRTASAGDLLMVAIGLINPLALVYLVLVPIRNSYVESIRRAVSITTLCLIPTTWIYFVIYKVSVEIGHIAWVLGIAVMMIPEYFRPSPASPQPTASGGEIGPG
jgi:hypothetical protein